MFQMFFFLCVVFSEFRDMILDADFVSMCRNLSDAHRVNLTLQWADDIQLYILTVDELRGSFVIPSILQVILPCQSISVICIQAAAIKRN